MKVSQIENMVKGWFVGDFNPTAFQTDVAEVAVKKYKAGDYEDWHYHKIATELTLIVSGEVEMNGKRYKAGDIVVMEPNEGTDFRALSDVTNVVVKVPSAKNDKYLRGQ